MKSQVIVPHRPGPLLDVPEGGTGPSAPSDEGIGLPEIVLSVGGGALLAAVLFAGLPGWLSVVAVACLSLGLALPAHAAFLRALRRGDARRRETLLSLGTVLDVTSAPVRRLVAAYERLDRTGGPGLPRDAGHLALAEVATALGGRVPSGAEEEYVKVRAEAVSTLADRLAAGPVMPVELAGADSLARIEALLA